MNEKESYKIIIPKIIKKKKKIVKKKILEKVFSLKELGGMIRVLVLTPLSSIFQLYGIVAVSFIDGENHRPAASN
jgi:hypothetical protein